ncbi:hypothetical protein PLICRDRAFT_180353 [Plicaturopsis crispa FD-325 SS-3]|uniref:Uncharacterized protein n=1 Tax=Plicaturopsis crispa FD-325 SS-3 TaxID=944288 RepID=A0A0C9SW25_PLICR|nr:hypothetical protein PLICRDRAFT_180353 [Plicaturopsis crispa FD-325 SS-3]
MNGDSHDADLFRRFLEFQQAQGSASGAGSPQAPTTRGSATSHHPSSAPPASQFAASSPSQGVAGPSTEQLVPGSLFHPLVPASSSTSTHIGRSAPGSSLASAAPSYPGISPPTASTLHPQPTSQSAQSQHMPISQPYPSAQPTTSTGFQPFLGMQNLGILRLGMPIKPSSWSFATPTDTAKARKARRLPSLGNPRRLNCLPSLLQVPFSETLRRYGLLHSYELPHTTTIVDLVNIVANDMQQSQFHYTFKQTRLGGLAARLGHALPPLVLLSLKDKGRARPSDGQVRLRSETYSSTFTVSNVMADKNRFTRVAGIEGDRLVIHLRASVYPLTCTIDGRRHTCISRRIYQDFRIDTMDDAGIDDESYSDSSGGEDVAGASTSSSLVGRHETQTPVGSSQGSDPAGSAGSSLVAPHASPVAAPSIQASRLLPPVPRPLTRASSRLIPRDTSFTAVSNYLPSTIWGEPWTPNVDGLLRPPVSMSVLAERVYKDATRGVDGVERLDVAALNSAALAASLDAMLATAVAQNDFTELLAPELNFGCYEDAKGDTISMGIGVEREAVFIAFQQYVRASTQWFNERQDGMSSILVTHPGGAAQFVP